MKIPAHLAALCLAGAFAGDAPAQADRPGAAMLRKYAGSDDTSALLNEPAVRAELQKLAGTRLKQLQLNLDVRGSVDVVGGMLAVSGNAPHRGTEEEAVVCVAPTGSPVQAAIFSRGAITVFARDPNYDNLTLCIKDWITQVNSQHIDRFKAPRNVRVAATR